MCVNSRGSNVGLRHCQPSADLFVVVFVLWSLKVFEMVNEKLTTCDRMS